MHPKSMYQMTSDGLVEKIASSFDEEWSMVKRGWYQHPEEARMAWEAGGQEEEPEKKSIHGMTKKELEEYARQFGIELDRRKSKNNMMKDLEDFLS